MELSRRPPPECCLRGLPDRWNTLRREASGETVVEPVVGVVVVVVVGRGVQLAAEVETLGRAVESGLSLGRMRLV